jgi:hypothetical protein
MVLHYLLSRNQVDGLQYSEDPRALLASKKLTFGRAHALISKASGYHDLELQERVGEYVAQRNTLAHHLFGRATRLELEAFFDLGCQIIDQLRTHAHSVIKAHEEK